MKKILLLAVAVPLLAANSRAEFAFDFLVTSNAFCAPSEALIDNRLLGQWQKGESQDTNADLEIEKEGNGYSVANAGSTNRVAMLQLFKLKKQFFVDAALLENCTEGGHILFRVEQFEPTLKLSVLSDWNVTQSLEHNPFVFTRFLGLRKGPPRKNASDLAGASTPELQAFILAHLDDSKIFDDDLVEFRRVPVARMENQPSPHAP